jgi:formylglycine-generating enzyme required for sulfatase activity
MSPMPARPRRLPRLLPAALLPAALSLGSGWPTVSTPVAVVKEGAKDAALVIAIEDYFVAQDLPGAVANGRDWAAWLSQGRGVPVVKPLFNETATKEDILTEAVRIAGQVKPGGRLWLVYIGHGAPSESGDDGLLVGVDARQTPQSLSARGLSRSELLRSVEAALPAGAEVVLVQDACFSGKTSRGDLAPGMAPLKVVSAALGPKVTALSGARSDEYAGPLSDGSRPAFSYLVLGALRGWGDENQDGRVTASEAVGYANRALVQTVTGRSQTAELSGPDVGLGRSAKERGPDLSAIAMAAVVVPGPAPAPAPAAAPAPVGAAAATAADVAALTEAVRALQVAQTSMVAPAPSPASAGRPVTVVSPSVGGGAAAPTAPVEVRVRQVPAGTYEVGCTPGAGKCMKNELRHTVTLTRSVLVMETEVTQGLWSAVMGSNPSRGASCASCPVEHVTWFDAVAFANALSRRDGLEECYQMSGEQPGWPKGVACEGWRLPTEAEWEVAARGGEDTRYAGGNELGAVGWYVLNSGQLTHPVGRRQANGYGLYDMSGNVWEWVWDGYGPYGGGTSVDPSGPSAASSRVFRGGGWNRDAQGARVANRTHGAPGDRYDVLGVRLLRTAP